LILLFVQKMKVEKRHGPNVSLPETIFGSVQETA